MINRKRFHISFFCSLSFLLQPIFPLLLSSSTLTLYFSFFTFHLHSFLSFHAFITFIFFQFFLFAFSFSCPLPFPSHLPLLFLLPFLPSSLISASSLTPFPFSHFSPSFLKYLLFDFNDFFWFRLALWHTNYCRLFNAKSSLYTYIRYI